MLSLNCGRCCVWEPCAPGCAAEQHCGASSACGITTEYGPLGGDGDVQGHLSTVRSVVTGTVQALPLSPACLQETPDFIWQCRVPPTTTVAAVRSKLCRDLLQSQADCRVVPDGTKAQDAQLVSCSSQRAAPTRACDFAPYLATR